MFLSLFYLLIAFIPVLIYVSIIWATSPLRSISLRTSFQYLFIGGLISTATILTYFKLFPNCQNPVPMFGILGPESLVFFCFIQIALVEEMSKLAAFHLGELVRREESIVDSPVATMFYAGISSFGFAFMENIDYIFQYGGSVIIIRSITSTMIHFLCGLILGYWVAASRMPSVLENRSLFEIILQTRPVLKKFIYYAIGITCAITLHGMYDYSCSNASSDPLMSYMIIFGGIISAYLAARRLVEKERK